MSRYRLPLIVLIPILTGCASLQNRHSDAAGAKTLFRFDGKSLAGFYTFLKGPGRDNAPNKVFTVSDGMIRISGQDWGCITTHDAYENYHLTAEFKWGTETWGNRKDRARDSGILLHSTGEDGAYGGMWMHSIECQMIEGGTGDILVVGDKSEKFAVTCPVADEKQGGSYLFKPDGKPVTIHGGRINWWGRDPAWKDVKDFRGKQDVEKPIGQWNLLECICKGSTIVIKLNGKIVNQCLDAKPTKGRLQIQSEGAELFVRRFELVSIGE